jgi:hypothetical protein
LTRGYAEQTNECNQPEQRQWNRAQDPPRGKLRRVTSTGSPAIDRRKTERIDEKCGARGDCNENADLGQEPQE